MVWGCNKSVVQVLSKIRGIQVTPCCFPSNTLLNYGAPYLPLADERRK
jgi:hypothetical protein